MKPLEHGSVAVTVVPASGLVRPQSAKVALNPSQRQFLATKAADLQGVLDQMNAIGDANGGDETSIRTQIADKLEEADIQLLKSKNEYAQIAPPNLNKNAVLFDDFDRQYKAEIIELRAPRNSRQLRSQKVGAYQPILYSRTGEPTQFQGSLASSLATAIGLVFHNVSAYLKIASTGSDRFKMSIQSVPQGATISYKRIGFDYVDLSKTTDVLNEEFDFALWTFKIQKGECFVIRHPDPYNESNLNFSVNLDCRKKTK